MLKVKKNYKITLKVKLTTDAPYPEQTLQKNFDSLDHRARLTQTGSADLLNKILDDALSMEIPELDEPEGPMKMVPVSVLQNLFDEWFEHAIGSANSSHGLDAIGQFELIRANGEKFERELGVVFSSDQKKQLK